MIWQVSNEQQDSWCNLTSVREQNKLARSFCSAITCIHCKFWFDQSLPTLQSLQYLSLAYHNRLTDISLQPLLRNQSDYSAPNYLYFIQKQSLAMNNAATMIHPFHGNLLHSKCTPTLIIPTNQPNNRAIIHHRILFQRTLTIESKATQSKESRWWKSETRETHCFLYVWFLVKYKNYEYLLWRFWKMSVWKTTMVVSGSGDECKKWFG